MSAITLCTKRFIGYPFAHRQHMHDGHCALVHGHNWDFSITFAAHSLDENGFVIDFGKMGFIKDWLADHFDHTFAVNEDDPHAREFLDLEDRGLAKVVMVPNGSAEGLAKFVWAGLNMIVRDKSKGRVYIVEVTVYESDRASATFAPPES